VSGVAQLRRALDDLANVPPVAVKQAAKVVEDFAGTQGRPITIRGKRYPLRAVTKETKQGRDIVQATVFGTPTGFWVWENTGTRGGYQIAPKPGTRNGRPRVLAGKTWGHPVSTPVTRHRGISGRGAWRRVDRYARQHVPQVFIDAVADITRGLG
jgi:hypothetical protein